MARAPADVGEARWPMAGAVLAAMALTILLPDDLRPGPRWLIPLMEGLLLVAVVAGDPGRINRRSRELRALSIVLVSVLVLSSIWATVLLIDDLINGGVLSLGTVMIRCRIACGGRLRLHSGSILGSAFRRGVQGSSRARRRP